MIKIFILLVLLQTNGKSRSSKSGRHSLRKKMNRTLCDALNSTLNLQFKWRGFPCCLMLPTFLQYCFLFTSIARRKKRKRERRAETSTSTMPSRPSRLKKKMFCPRVGGFRRGARCQPDVHRRPTNLEFNRRIATGKRPCGVI